MMATIMQALDTTIANVALPHMLGSLNATQEQASWILTSYIVAAAIMTAPTGFLAARIGRKRLFLISVAGFTLASILCGVAQNLSEMVFFRLMQGVFGAGLVPLSQAVLLDTYPKEKHGQAMALWGMGVMLGPILGPTLGGWLTEYYNWRWVFYINVPVGIATLLGIWFFMPETEKNPGRRFDVFGFVMLSLAIGGLQLMLDRGQGEDWFSSTEITVEFVIAALALYLFIVHINTTEKPFLEPAMFRDRNFASSLFFIFVVGIIMLASMALLPPYLQNLMGYPVITTGLVLAPRGFGTMLAMVVAGRLTQKVDARVLMLVGLLLTAYSLWQMSLFTTNVPMSLLVTTGMVQGFGMGLVFVPLSTVAYATLAPHYRNDAAAVFSLMRNIGSSVGISVVVTLLARNIQINHAELGGHLHNYKDLGAGLDAATEALSPSEGTALLQTLDGMVNQQAATIAYLNDFRLMAWVVLLSIPLLFILKNSRINNPVKIPSADH
ncbi:MAG: DHA2 family efflux MFS transporter permease subunit [Oceanospirillaceae bacterium]|nr:DHA2 family efflux MFS transporter permease subunit [Oceanospirillaceae bacterium]MCP5335939.1 DHA2 family efflux MFS transporter permease subunit [Oceanospirillaceae bacterium]MCP5350874.1 DHA2 family efflux MFS transporter permease subunit [Oceanospirillaceae bacterium]